MAVCSALNVFLIFLLKSRESLEILECMNNVFVITTKISSQILYVSATDEIKQFLHLQPSPLGIESSQL